MALLSEGFARALQLIFQFVVTFWWVPLPFILGKMLWNSWLYYKRTEFVTNLKWVLLELAVPQDVIKTPLAMEQIFTGIHSALYPGSWWQRYVNGRVQEWFSFEIVSVGGDIHFYIYTVDRFRNMVESHIYAQYPDAEIFEVEDYTRNIPQAPLKEDYDITGAELVLKKPDAYPIRVWRDFEFESKEGEANIDPMAGLLESLSSLKEGEQFWLQFGLKPVGDDWKKEGEAIVAELAGKKAPSKGKEKKSSHFLSVLTKELGDFAFGAIQAPFKIPEYDSLKLNKSAEAKEEGPTSQMMHLTPGEREVIEAIEKNITKVGFETAIRAVYISPKEIHNPQTFFAVASAFRQFSSQNLNNIGWNRKTLTFSEWPLPWPKIIPKSAGRYRKRWLLFKYRFRWKPEKPSVYSVEELATMFHFPGRIITTPTLPRIGIKKGEPPAGLPIQ